MAKIMNDTRKALWVRGVLLLVLLVMVVLVAIKYSVPITRLISDTDRFAGWLASFGSAGAMVFILCQSFQVVVAPIPGEITQFAGGVIYGTWWGTLYSMAGILLGSMVVFMLGRIFGLPLLKRMIPEAAFTKFGFLLNHPRTELAILFLFLIPGSPKDWLTYIAGLTPVRPLYFFSAAMVARFPGILLSSYIGANVGEKNETAVIIASSIALGLFVAGVLMHDRIAGMFRHHKERS